KIAGVPGAVELLTDALAVLDARFWEPEQQLHLDERSRDWSSTSDYRGVNANMHSVEALLAAHAATGDAVWLDRAAAIGDRVISWAEGNEWRIPEHFDAAWTPQLEYNADRPHDPFKPYGATPGHGLEWARLLLQIDAEAGTEGRRQRRRCSTVRWRTAGTRHTAAGSCTRRTGRARPSSRAASTGWPPRRCRRRTSWAASPVRSGTTRSRPSGGAGSGRTSWTTSRGRGTTSSTPRTTRRDARGSASLTSTTRRRPRSSRSCP